MALVQHASTPAVASANANTITTASFTPPVGAVLYAIASSDANDSTVPATSNISGTAGLTWTLRADTNTLAVSNGAQARLWTATVSTSVSMTVTFTVTAGGFNGVVLAVKVMTGADALDPVEGAVVGASSTTVSQAVSGSSGSKPWIASVDYSTPLFTVTPNGSTTQDYMLNPFGSSGAGFFGGYGSTFSSPGSVTLGASNSTSGHKIQWIGFSMRALDATRPSISGTPQGLGFTASGTTFTYTGGGVTGSGCFDVLCVNGDNTVATPSGWLLARSEVANQGAYIFYKAENGVNSAVLNLGGGISTDEAATWMRIKNAGGIDVVGGAQVNSSASNTPPSFTSSTLAGSNELTIAHGALHKFVTATTPPPGTWSTGYLEQATAVSGAAGSTTGAYNSTATKSPAGTAAESPAYTATNGTFERYLVFASFTPVSTGGSSQNGAAALTAASGLTAAAVRATSSAAAMTAVSNVTAAATQTASGAVTMTAASTLTVAAQVTKPAAVAMTSSSNLTTAAVTTRLGAIAMTAASNLTTGATTIRPGAATMSVDSNLSVAGLLTASASAPLTAASSLTAAATTAPSGGVAMTAATQLTTTASRTTTGAAALTAQSALTAAAANGNGAAATMTAVSSLTAGALYVGQAGISMTAASNLVVAAVLTRIGAAPLTATSQLTTAGTTAPTSGAQMTALSSLTAAGIANTQAAAILTAASGLLAAATGGTNTVRRPGVLTVSTRRSTLAAGTVRGPSYASGGGP